jgi:hypothetical protein
MGVRQVWEVRLGPHADEKVEFQPATLFATINKFSNVCLWDGGYRGISVRVYYQGQCIYQVFALCVWSAVLTDEVVCKLSCPSFHLGGLTVLPAEDTPFFSLLSSFWMASFP